MEQAIVIFTRVPEAGKTKTRMMPHLTAGQCKKLHTYFLKDIRKECEKTGADIFVCYTPNGEENETEIKAILGKEKGYFPQKGETLGERTVSYTHLDVYKRQEEPAVFRFCKLSNKIVKRRECYGKGKEICRSDYIER